MNRKILFVDLFSPRGHFNFNMIYLQAINNIPDVTVDVAFVKGFIDEMGLDRVLYENSFELKKYETKKTDIVHKVLWRLYQVLNLCYCRNLQKKRHYDYIIFSSFDELVYSLFGIHKKNVLAVYHQDANHLFESPLILKCMRFISKRIHIIILNKAYSQRLTSEGVRNYFVPHGIIKAEKIESGNCRSIFVPINEAVDYNVVNDLVSNKFSDLLVRLNVIMTIKKYPCLYKSYPNIIIIEKKIPADEYKKLFNTSDLIILPYDKKEYKYRTSAMLFETVAYGKYVAIPSAEAFQSLHCEEDTGMFIYNSIDDIIEFVKRIFGGENIEKPLYNGIETNNGGHVITKSLIKIMDGNEG